MPGPWSARSRKLAERSRSGSVARSWPPAPTSAEIVAGPPDGLSFGERLAAEVRARAGAEAKGSAPRAAAAERAAARDAAEPAADGGGLVVLGSGSIPLARAADLRRFVEAAAGPGGHALANNRYSADVVAISRAADLAGLPPLPADNALPRWLEEWAGVAVTDLRSRWRLGVDIDTPLDLIVLRDPAARELHATAPLVGERLAALAEVISNRRAELLVAGRVSARTLAWLERGVACRVRALVEERGLRAASALAQSGGKRDARHGGATAGATGNVRPPRSILGELLDRDGPESLAHTVSKLADAAVVDTRVLLAHRAGPADSPTSPSPASSPDAEERFASDLLLPASIADPWLRALASSAATAPSDHPILLGGHTLLNGGLRLLAERARAGAR